MTVAEGCLPLLCAPSGPDTPFTGPLLTLLDSVRVLMMLAGFFVISRCVRAIMLIHNRFQRSIYFSVIVAVLTIIGTEADHLGDYAHYRLVASALMIAAAMYGTWRISSHVQDWDTGSGAHHPRP